MPSVMDAPELVAYVETHDLAIETLEPPRPRQPRPGFWRSLVHKITPHLTPAPACSTRQPVETPLDWLVREHPSHSVYVLAMI
jgi:hypothetical protein